jgi:hypothetical protein
MHWGADRSPCGFEEAGDMTLASNKATSRLESPRRAAAALCHRLASQTPARLGRRAVQGSPKVRSCSQNVASDGDISGGEGSALLARVAGRLPRLQPSLVIPLCNSALEQAASAARPWQTAQREHSSPGGPRPVPRPPLLTASVTQILFVVHERLTRRRALQGIIFLPVG